MFEPFLKGYGGEKASTMIPHAIRDERKLKGKTQKN